MDNKKEKGMSQINIKSFATALIVIALLMVLSYIIVLLTPGCSIPVWKWALSPFLVVGGSNSSTIIAIILFLIVIGGIFNALEKCGLMKYMLEKIAHKFGKTKYTFLAVVMFFFMAMGAAIGSFEECVPLVPIVVALSVKLGWDSLTGLGMSLLAVGCGFASGLFNPFTVGVAQELAGLPMFSGAWLRGVGFVLIYLLLFLFVYFHAKSVDKGIEYSSDEEYSKSPKMEKALAVFGIIMLLGIISIICSNFIPFLKGLAMILVAVMFLIAGISSTLVSGMKFKSLMKSMLDGLVSMLPAILLILMASSIGFTLEESGALDVILEKSIELAKTLPKWSVILFIYLIVLIMNFFIASGSAKAFLLIPLIVPLAQNFGISAQLCIVAFAFGDGFSNVFYPTNPVLLIGLGLSDESYGNWFKWTWFYQVLNLILTSGILLLGLAVGY